MKSVYYWSPFLTDVATTSAVIQSAISLKKYSKIHKPIIIDVCGEFKKYDDVISKNNVELKKLVNFNYFNLLPKNGYFKSRLSFIIIFICSAYPLFKILKRDKPDFLICHLITSLPILLASTFMFKTKFILRISGLPRLNIVRKLYWLICGKALNKITSPTEATLNELREKKLFNNNKLFLLRDPVIDIKKINMLKKNKIENFLDKQEFLVGIGRLTKQKNFIFLINCFHKIAMSDKNLKLVILGEGEERKKLTQMISKYNLQEKIYLLGYKENVFNYLSKAKIFILSSLWEDPGWVLLEAAASNTLILSSNCKNGPSEIIEKNKSGFLYEVNNEKDFVEKFNIIKGLSNSQIKLKKIYAKKKSYQYTKFQHFKVLETILKN